MRVLKRGHRYELDHRNGTNKTIVQYVNTESGQECEGVIQQELLRMMLDRNRYCTACLPNSVSERIQYHLRMALVLHEMRALERKVQKGELAPEYINTGDDGHFELFDILPKILSEETRDLKPYRQEWELECNHHSAPANEEEQEFSIRSKYSGKTIGFISAKTIEEAATKAHIKYGDTLNTNGILITTRGPHETIDPEHD